MKKNPIDTQKIGWLALAGAGILGVYFLMKGNVPGDHKFSELEYQLSKNPAVTGDTITVSGSFIYAGPGELNLSIVVDIAHEPFGELFEDGGNDNIGVLPASSGKKYTFSMNVQLNHVSHTGSPYDIQIRYYDQDNMKTLDKRVDHGVLEITVQVYSTGYSVSPAGAGNYYGGSESGVMENSTDYTWLSIDVFAKSGWVFDHWECSGGTEFMYANTVKKNSVRNVDGGNIIAFFVPASQRAIWNFRVLPDNEWPANIWISINGEESFSPTNGSDVGFSIGDSISIYAEGMKRNSFWPWEPEYWLLDYWELDGYNYGSSNPISFNITDLVNHSIILHMK